MTASQTIRDAVSHLRAVYRERFGGELREADLDHAPPVMADALVRDFGGAIERDRSQPGGEHAEVFAVVDGVQVHASVCTSTPCYDCARVSKAARSVLGRAA